VLDVVVGHFSPEFVNRIDETVVFHPLGQSQIRGIAELQLELLNQRLILNGLSLQVSTAALDQIALLGYDPVYGARPLKRAIQNWIENPLAQSVLQGLFLPGDIISLDLSAELEFVFSKS
jgi:ATP-dependent Clp protease ATP-binding subunit ClpB